MPRTAKNARDKKNRVLRTGERQRADGRYEYRFTDSEGKVRSIYSWKLVDTDKVEPSKDGPSLREMARQIQIDLAQGMEVVDPKIILLDKCFEENMSTRHLKDSTRENYFYMYNKYIKPVFGSMPITEIKYSDIKKFYYSLIEEKGFAPNSMETVHTILHPIFTTAVRDGYLRVNPTDGAMAEIKRGRDWKLTKRTALTARQQERLMEYVIEQKEDRWSFVLTIMLGTGCRVGEAMGLTWDDCDFDNGWISINHNLIYRKNMKGDCKYSITTPKTQAGIREIPMFEVVKRALLIERNRQQRMNYPEIEIDGYKGFIFRNRYGELLNPHSINRALERIVKEYNEREDVLAIDENRPPEYLPKITNHILRHSFCSRLCENTSDTNTLKTIQEIMGHRDISTTLDVYTDLTREHKRVAFDNLEDKICLSIPTTKDEEAKDEVDEITEKDQEERGNVDFNEAAQDDSIIPFKILESSDCKGNETLPKSYPNSNRALPKSYPNAYQALPKSYPN